MAEFWTTEQVAEHLGIEVREIYQSRRNGDWPGIVGTQRGRRLLFRSDLIEAGPQETESTEDVTVAILWTLQGIEAKLGKILTELVSQRTQPPTWLTMDFTDEIEGDGKEWTEEE